MTNNINYTGELIIPEDEWVAMDQQFIDAINDIAFSHNVRLDEITLKRVDDGDLVVTSEEITRDEEKKEEPKSEGDN